MRWEYLGVCLYLAGVVGVLLIGLVPFWLVVGTVVGVWCSTPQVADQLDRMIGRNRSGHPEPERIP